MENNFLCILSPYKALEKYEYSLIKKPQKKHI